MLITGRRDEKEYASNSFLAILSQKEQNVSLKKKASFL